MSYNINTWRTKKLKELVIPVKEFYSEDIEKDWQPEQPVIIDIKTNEIEIGGSGEEFIVKYVKDFSADLNSNRVLYNFFIPCHVSATSSYKEIKLSMYDSTYYTDIMLANQNPVSFVNTSQIEHRCEIQDNTKKAFYYGQVFPQEIILTFKKKK